MSDVDVEKSGAEYGKVNGNADGRVRECAHLARKKVRKRSWMGLRVRTLKVVR